MLKFYVVKVGFSCFFLAEKQGAKKRYKNIEKKQNAYCLFEFLVLVCIWGRLGLAAESSEKPFPIWEFPGKYPEENPKITAKCF